MNATSSTPFQQGKTAFSAGASRFNNPYHVHQDSEKHVEWEAGYNHGVEVSVIQPDGNEYAMDVYAGLLVLARSFEERQYFSVAEELRFMAARGPEQRKGLDKFSTPDVLQVASERLAEIARMAQRG